MGVSLHRDPAAGRMPEQLLGDAGVRTSVHGQAHRIMALVMEAHPGEPSTGEKAWNCFVNQEALTARPLAVTKTSESPSGTMGRSASMRARWARGRSTTNIGSGIVATEEAVLVSTKPGPSARPGELLADRHRPAFEVEVEVGASEAEDLGGLTGQGPSCLRAGGVRNTRESSASDWQVQVREGWE